MEVCMNNVTLRTTFSWVCMYIGYAVSMWLGIRLQMLGVAMVTGVAFIAVLEHHFNTVNAGTFNCSKMQGKYIHMYCAL